MTGGGRAPNIGSMRALMKSYTRAWAPGTTLANHVGSQITRLFKSTNSKANRQVAHAKGQIPLTISLPKSLHRQHVRFLSGFLKSRLAGAGLDSSPVSCAAPRSDCASTWAFGLRSAASIARSRRSTNLATWLESLGWALQFEAGLRVARCNRAGFTLTPVVGREAGLVGNSQSCQGTALKEVRNSHGLAFTTSSGGRQTWRHGCRTNTY